MARADMAHRMHGPEYGIRSPHALALAEYTDAGHGTISHGRARLSAARHYMASTRRCPARMRISGIHFDIHIFRTWLISHSNTARTAG